MNNILKIFLISDCLCEAKCIAVGCTTITGWPSPSSPILGIAFWNAVKDALNKVRARMGLSNYTGNAPSSGASMTATNWNDTLGAAIEATPLVKDKFTPVSQYQNSRVNPGTWSTVLQNFKDSYCVNYCSCNVFCSCIGIDN